MNNEMEDGEVYSDDEAGGKRSAAAAAAADEDDDDEIILKLKYNALRSKLLANNDDDDKEEGEVDAGDSELSNSPKKPLRKVAAGKKSSGVKSGRVAKAAKKRHAKARHDPHNDDDDEYEDESRFELAPSADAHLNDSSNKYLNGGGGGGGDDYEQKLNNFLNKIGSSSGSKDNYELLDMDIESPSYNPTQPPPPPQPPQPMQFMGRSSSQHPAVASFQNKPFKFKKNLKFRPHLGPPKQYNRGPPPQQPPPSTSNSFAAGNNSLLMTNGGGSGFAGGGSGNDAQLFNSMLNLTNNFLSNQTIASVNIDPNAWMSNFHQLIRSNINNFDLSVNTDANTLVGVFQSLVSQACSMMSANSPNGGGGGGLRQSANFVSQPPPPPSHISPNSQNASYHSYQPQPPPQSNFNSIPRVAERHNKPFRRNNPGANMKRYPNLGGYETQQTGLFGGPVGDIDERFIDHTGGRLDVDYRRMEAASATHEDDRFDEMMREQSKILSEAVSVPAPVVEAVDQATVDEEQKEEDDEDNEEERQRQEKELSDLRAKLIKNITEKRLQAKKIQEEQQMNEDVDVFKKKLQEHEQELTKKEEEAAAKTSGTGQAVQQARRISPIIITLNQSPDEDEDADTSDCDDDDAVDPEKEAVNKFRQTVSLFLNEIKNQAASKPAEEPVEPEPRPPRSNRVVVIAAPATVPATVAATTAKSSGINNDELIKSLRDKINLKTATISELTNKSIGLKQASLKKEKDIETTRQKISILREQLSAAEKILKANEDMFDEMVKKQQAVESELTKWQTLKKNQQKILQKLLIAKSSSSTATVAAPAKMHVSSSASVLADGGGKRTELLRVSSLTSSLAQAAKSVPVSLNKSVSVTPNSSAPTEKPQPPPPLPKESPPPLPPPPTTETAPPLPPNEQPAPQEDASAAPATPQELPKAKLPSMTLGAMIAQTVASDGGGGKGQQRSTKAPGAQNAAVTRPNVFISKQTNRKLEQIAQTSQTKPAAEYHASGPSDEKIVVSAQVVSMTKASKGSPMKSGAGLKRTPGSATKPSAAQHESKQVDSLNRQMLAECLQSLAKDFPYVHSESLELWSNESTAAPLSHMDVFRLDCDANEARASGAARSESDKLTITCATYLRHATDLGASSSSSSTSSSSGGNTVYIIDDVSKYESPLKAFRGYRFSSHFAAFNEFEEIYSKEYCHAIDFRKPFCPFDLHGSCKDSNCPFQHTNVMSMDNYQRTEHFLTYCPQVLGLESQELRNQAEVVKKLKSYAQAFMNTHLNKMSIKDYFRHLYNHVVENLKLDPPYSTILSRLPVLCLNNNRSIGAFEQLNIESSSSEDAAAGADRQSGDAILELLELVLQANLSRSLELKLANLANSGLVSLEMLKREQTSPQALQSTEIVMAWVHFARATYSTALQASTLTQQGSVVSNSIEKLLNVLSNALEYNPKSELLWLVYLQVYLGQRNALKDYHEICLLCLDNLVTYKLIWLVFNTCPFEYLGDLVEKYESFLVRADAAQLAELEQMPYTTNAAGSEDEDGLARVSYYLLEMIVFHVNTTLLMVEGKGDRGGYEQATQLLMKYLSAEKVVARMEASDVCLLWLSVIYLHAFRTLPSMIGAYSLSTRGTRHVTKPLYWEYFKRGPDELGQRQHHFFFKDFFGQLGLLYSSSIAQTRRLLQASKGDQAKFAHLVLPSHDSFILPWNFKSAGAKNSAQSPYACPLETLQRLFHEALKAINGRCQAYVCYDQEEKKRLSRLESLPLFINLIKLEVANRRFEVANKLCERLLQSSDAGLLKEIWLCKLYILRCQKQTLESKQTAAAAAESLDEIAASIEKTVEDALGTFPLDAQIVYVAGQHYSSKGQTQKSLDLIANLVKDYYADSDLAASLDTDVLFKHLLGLNGSTTESSVRLEFQKTADDSLAEKLDAILSANQKEGKIPSLTAQLVHIGLCYCLHVQLSRPIESLQLLRPTSELFERLIGSFKSSNHRTLLWSRYFKLVSTLDKAELTGLNEFVLELVRKCVRDLSESSLAARSGAGDEIITPFYHSPALRPGGGGCSDGGYCLASDAGLAGDASSLRSSEPVGLGQRPGIARKCSPNNKLKRDATTTAAARHHDLHVDYYYHNCIVDLLLKLFCAEERDRHGLLRFVLELMPDNLALVRLFSASNLKLHGPKHTIQALYDHLSIHSIDNEQLWILCIKICIELNDLQQVRDTAFGLTRPLSDLANRVLSTPSKAILIYQKAESVCRSQRRSTNLLRRLAAYLFPVPSANAGSLADSGGAKVKRALENGPSKQAAKSLRN